jgi:hypothetical protein
LCHLYINLGSRETLEIRFLLFELTQVPARKSSR